MLHRLGNEFRLTIEEINIEGDDALFKKYFDQIPLLLIDNQTTFAAPIHEDDVRAALIS